MKAAYINPFIESSICVFEKMLGCGVNRTGLAVCDAFAPEYDITGLIGLSGQVAGDVVISFEKSLALRATETLIGDKHDVINEDVIDTIGELTNMIAGNAKANMEALKLKLALPTVVVGKSHSIRFPSNVKPISLAFESDWGSFNIQVGLLEPSLVSVG